MSLGWGNVSASDWKELKTQPGADQVPPGDYEVQVESYLHFEPSKESGVGSHLIVTKTTAKNEIGAGKELHLRFNYAPNPSTGGQEKMNLISLQHAKELFQAIAVPEELTPAGTIDVVETLKKLPKLKPTLVLAIKDGKEGKDGKSYQEAYKFRPSPGA